MKSLSQRARRLIPLGPVVGVVALVHSLLDGHLLLNVTPSIPRGIYWISTGEIPRRGGLVALPIPSAVQDLIYERQYLPRSIKLLAKPIAASPGDHVCIRDGTVFLNKTRFSTVTPFDAQGRPMPKWPICRLLASNELYLATQGKSSFDSRHFGPVLAAEIRGALTPLLTF